MISVVYLGRVDYAAALALQRQLTERRKLGSLPDLLLLLEHPPVLTLGRNARPEHILATEASLSRRGIAVFVTDRGGDVTYHGPGQLVGYPILDLRGFTPTLGAIEYVRKLEEVLRRSCADYGILTGRVGGRTGVWTTPAGAVPEKKIAAIGVHISRGVTSHGFALNVTADLDQFQMIVPCGISDRGVTSIEAEIDEGSHPAPTLEQAAHSIGRHFARVFAQPVLWVESLEALTGAEALQSGSPMEEMGKESPCLRK